MTEAQASSAGRVLAPGQSREEMLQQNHSWEAPEGKVNKHRAQGASKKKGEKIPLETAY